MRKYVSILCGVLSLIVLPMIEGQVTSSGGVANAIPKYSSPTSLTSSAITDANGSVTLTEPLVVNGGSASSGTPSFSVTGFQQYGVGIEFNIANQSGVPEWGSTSAILFTGGNRPNGFSMIQSGGTDFSGGNGFLAFQTTSAAVLSEVMRLAPGGNVGIGTTAPGSKLEVKGNIAITSGSGGGLVFADGTELTSASFLTTPATTLGTITAGVWNGTPLLATYLPTDVAYTDTAQNITGQKTFASNVGIGTPRSLLKYAPVFPTSLKLF